MKWLKCGSVWISRVTRVSIRLSRVCDAENLCFSSLKHTLLSLSSGEHFFLFSRHLGISVSGPEAITWRWSKAPRKRSHSTTITTTIIFAFFCLGNLIYYLRAVLPVLDYGSSDFFRLRAAQPGTPTSTWDERRLQVRYKYNFCFWFDNVVEDYLPRLSQSSCVRSTLFSSKEHTHTHEKR